MSTTIVVKRLAKKQPMSRKCNLTAAYTVVDGTHKTVVKDEKGNVIAVHLPQVLSAAEIEAGRKLIRYKSTTTSRNMAAGMNVAKVPRYGNGRAVSGSALPVFSSVIGYLESTHLLTCRQTAMTRKHRDMFNDDTMLLVRKISRLFKTHAPAHYARQKAFVDTINPHMVLPKTVFTTATVNVDFRTLTHTDNGDYEPGLGNLAVFQEPGKKWRGAEFLMPDFGLAIRMHEGDVLFANVHETHCNATRVGSGRISLVLYARKRLATRCQKTSKKILETGPMSMLQKQK